MKYSVFLLSPNAIAREGLSRIIEQEGFEVVSAWSSAEEAVQSGVGDIDLGLIDVPVPDEQIRSMNLINAHRPGNVVVLADVFDLPTMLECFVQGAGGYIVKNMPCTALIASLRLAVLGHKIMPSELSDRLMRDMASPQLTAAKPSPNVGEDMLTVRERDVLRCLLSGDANKIIARKLDVSEATIKVHVKAIFRKLNVLNRTQAAIWANARGFDAMDPAAMI
jgi:two-component system, NarL family, nitrate/nitrite response regulator NarL